MSSSLIRSTSAAVSSVSSSFLHIEFSVPKTVVLPFSARHPFPCRLRVHFNMKVSHVSLSHKSSTLEKVPLVCRFFYDADYFFSFSFETIFIAIKAIKCVLLLYFLFIFKEKKKDYTLPYMVKRSGDLVVPGTASLFIKRN